MCIRDSLIANTGMSKLILADGSPRYSMISMLIGAIVNTILDPLFIFVFDMGMTGAALATITGQIISFSISLRYMFHFKTIKLDKSCFKLSLSHCRKIFILGASACFNQIAMTVVQIVMNNTLSHYGAQSVYGGDIPLACAGIITKVNMIFMSFVIGISQGTQPVIGFNYGAKKYDRVRKTLKIVLGSSLVISTIAFILFQTIPDKLILIFGNGDAKYMEFACLAFRTYLLLCICNGVQIPSGIFFQAIGKSTKSAILSLSRQIVILIPAMIILSGIYGIMGVLSAGPVADGLAFVLAVILLVKETRNMKNDGVETEKAERLSLIHI